MLCAPLQGGAGVGPTCAVCPPAGWGWGGSHLCCAPPCRFNFPAMIPLWMFPLAIVTGNTFVLKPSERDPGAAMALVALAQEAGVPDGVLNVIHGRKSAVDFVCDHPAIRAISFVGSDTVVSSQVLSRHSLSLFCAVHCPHYPHGLFLGPIHLRAWVHERQTCPVQHGCKEPRHCPPLCGQGPHHQPGETDSHCVTPYVPMLIPAASCLSTVGRGCVWRCWTTLHGPLHCHLCWQDKGLDPRDCAEGSVT